MEVCLSQARLESPTSTSMEFESQLIMEFFIMCTIIYFFSLVCRRLAENLRAEPLRQGAFSHQADDPVPQDLQSDFQLVKHKA